MRVHSVLRFGGFLCVGAALATLGSGLSQKLSAARGQVTTANLATTDYFDISYASGASRPAGLPSQYSVLVVKLDLGDSTLNKQDRRSLWNRFLQYFWKDSNVASFSVSVKGQQALPFYAVVKDANDEQLNPSVGDRRVSSPFVVGPADTIPVSFAIAFADHVQSSVATAALRAAGIVTTALGGGPASVVVGKIPQDATNAVDTFLGAINSQKHKLEPSIQLTGSQLANTFSYVVTIYDAPRSNNARKTVATLTLTADQFPSLYKTDFPLTTVDDLHTSVLHKTFDGKTEKDGGTSVYKLVRDDSLYQLSLKSTYNDYVNFCQGLPNLLGQFGFSNTDVLLQEYALLSAADGGSKRRDPSADVCPGHSVGDAFRKLGLPPLPAETYDPGKIVDRDRLNQAFGAIATAAARGAGFADLARGLVLVRQSVDLFPGVAHNEDHELGGDEIEEFLASVGAVRVGKFDYTGEGERSGNALLRLYRRSKTPTGPDERYKLRVVLDTDYQVQRMTLDRAS